MWDARRFRELVSGRQRGLAAAMWRAALSGLSIPYGLGTAVRNRLFDLGWKRSYRVSAPVISIGNLTAGGTGKTPLAAWIIAWARRNNVRLALISRGYGAAGGGPNDEALELARRFPDLVHLQNADRVTAAREAIERHAAQLILLDDGFQHRRLARDLDLVLLDALEPFGFGRQLPRGLLRESLAGLRRAAIVGLSRADLVDELTRERIREQATRWAPGAAWIELSHQPTGLRSAEGAERSWSELAGKRVAAFAGIGNPDGFRRTLAAHNIEVAAWREYPDHHAYSESDRMALDAGVRGLSASVDGVVCTGKDLVKLAGLRCAGLPVEALLIETCVTRGANELEAALESLRRVL